jgi:hypothetical protein
VYILIYWIEILLGQNALLSTVNRHTQLGWSTIGASISTLTPLIEASALKVKIPHLVDSNSVRQVFMDAISALGVAGDILTVTEFSVQLLSASDVSKVSSALEEKDETSVIEDFGKLRLSLSNKRASLQQRLLTGPSPPLKDELALLELASSSLENSGVLLDAIGNIHVPKSFPGNSPQSWKTDKKAWVNSKLKGRFSIENVKALSHIVTRHASSILR